MTNFKNVHFGSRSTSKQYTSDGSVLYFLTEDLQSYPNHITEKLDFYANQCPDHIFIARKDQYGEWIKLSYADTLQKVKSIASYLLKLHWTKNDTIVILSENSLEHALLALAALYIGIPYSPISPAYSLVSHDLNKLQHCLSVMNPKLVFAQDGIRYQNALQHIKRNFPDVEIVTVDGNTANKGFGELVTAMVTTDVSEAHEKVSYFTIAKILFTSGSTGHPKGVINTHGMWCANLQQITQAMPFMGETPLVLIDWLPWNHTFGGNHNFGLTLYHGGSIYIDDGKATAQAIEITVQNLKEISPTAYFNVPKGFEMLIPYLEKENSLRDHFFSNLNMIFYAGAGLSQPVWNKLEELSVKSIGVKVPIITGLGCTESGPSALFANWPGAYSGLLGVPVAELKVKLVKDGDKWEARYKGPNITTGYWKNEEATYNAFDEEGFYKTGDAVKFVSDDPDDGLAFDGRIAEDFKLSTGTWVNVGILRASIIASGAPLIQDVVLTGINQDFIGAILFLNQVESIKIAGLNADTPVDIICQHIGIKSFLEAWQIKFNASSTGSSSYIKKYIIATTPPSLEKGEITDKGSLNQRAVLIHRADIVTKMYQS